MSRTAENVCDMEPPAVWLNLDWMKVPAVQKRVGCASTHGAKGLYSQPFGSEEEMFASLGVQCSGTECHMPSTIACP